MQSTNTREMPKLATADVKFLTTNVKKGQDLAALGFAVQENQAAPREILSRHCAMVALYKSKHTGIINGLVEDTALSIQGVSTYGTLIKDFWLEIAENQQLAGRHCVWEVAICLELEKHFLLATGKTEGHIRFPLAAEGYAFEKFFGIWDPQQKQNTHWPRLTAEQRFDFSPRTIAVKKLKKAIEISDYTELTVVTKELVPEWCGPYAKYQD